MAISIEYHAVAGTAAADGLMIPIGALKGLDASEVASTESDRVREAKIVLAIFASMRSAILDLDDAPLGFSLVAQAPIGVAENLARITHVVDWQRLVDLESQDLSVLPVPTTGTNNGKGKLELTTVFSGATKVADGGTTVAGVVIPTAEVAKYSSVVHASLDVSEDGREYLMGLSDYLISNVVIRTEAGQQSAITRAFVGDLEGLILGDSRLIDATNPTSGIDRTKLTQLGVVERQTAITIEIKLNQSSQAFDVDVS